MATLGVDYWIQHGFKISIMGLASLCILLYTQQNNIIASQGHLIKENCDKTEKALNQKVDNRVLMEMIKRIEAKQESDD